MNKSLYSESMVTLLIWPDFYVINDSIWIRHTLVQFEPLDHEIAFNEALISERESDLLSVEKSVAQVNEIFRDLGTLVHEQQYMLDNIEANVTSVGVNVENATTELRTANQYQRSATRKWLCLLGVALVVLLILILSMRPWTWGNH